MYELMNQFGEQHLPFIFITDFEGKNLHVYPTISAASNNVFYNMRGKSNICDNKSSTGNINYTREPISYQHYLNAFNHAQSNLQSGNSYLLNLTFPTKLHSDQDLLSLYQASRAPYRIYFRDQFVSFSPECFIRISNSRIATYPMKGTINADLPDAENLLLNDSKEIAEHVTIVDLLRNDLSMVAHNVKVNRFRYLDRINTNQKNLLQTSSEISGDLSPDWHNNIGNILQKLLPAGSVTGAPKKKTVQIIREAEQYERGYYTGVAGIYDGNSLDSFVLIRFIEKINGSLYYKSGGGITVYSQPEKEYQEMIDKVYVPLA